jgi:hypothetical protein
MHMLSVTAALILSVIAGILTASAVLLPDSVARASLGTHLPAVSAEPCGEVGPSVYTDALGEPVPVGCLPPPGTQGSPAPAPW